MWLKVLAQACGYRVALKQLRDAILQTNSDRKKEDPQPQSQGAPDVANGGEPKGEGSHNDKDPGGDESAPVLEDEDMAAVAASKRKAEGNLDPANKNGCESDDDELFNPDLQHMQEVAKRDNPDLSLEQIQELDKLHGNKFTQGVKTIRKAKGLLSKTGKDWENPEWKTMHSTQYT